MTGEAVSKARELVAAKEAEVSVWRSQIIRQRNQLVEAGAVKTSDL
jgi:hypothetical protein